MNAATIPYQPVSTDMADHLDLNISNKQKFERAKREAWEQIIDPDTGKIAGPHFACHITHERSRRVFACTKYVAVENLALGKHRLSTEAEIAAYEADFAERTRVCNIDAEKVRNPGAEGLNKLAATVDRLIAAQAAQAEQQPAKHKKEPGV